MKVFLVILGAILYAGIGMFMEWQLGWGDPTIYYAVGAFAGMILMAIDVVEGE